MSSSWPQGIQIGTFIKTLSPHVVEVIGTTDLDFVVVDAEHGPFDRTSLDTMALAGRAAGKPLFIRVPEVNATAVLSCLDLGATGLLLPHIDSAEDARAAVAMARYRGGNRGFSSGPRFAGYGSLSMTQALDLGDKAQLICQIESPQAVAEAAAIAATPGVAGLFVGRADLALAMGLEDPKAAVVMEAAREVLRIARAAGKRAGIHVNSIADRDQFADAGADWIVVSSDQGLLRQAVQAIAATSLKGARDAR